MDPFDFQPKKILVPVDFSKYNQQALRSAVGLAKLTGASLTLLHVAEDSEAQVPYMAYINWREVAQRIEAHAKEALGELAWKVPKDVQHEERLAWGDPSTKITSIAEDDGFGLIVLTTHGRTGLHRLFIGGVAEQVVRHAGCPVLVIRSEE